MSSVLGDLKYSWRTIRRDWVFSLVVVLTLALGIGANTALFTVVNASLIQPLPFPSPSELVRVTADFNQQGVKDLGLSIPELLDLRASAIFQEVAGVWPISANLTETDQPERVESALVDANYFSMLGVGAEAGRVFVSSDAQPGIAPIAVISHALWMRRFGGDSGVIGKRVRIDNDLYTIIGVTPDWFRHPGRSTETEVEVWAPSGWLAAPFSPQPIRRAYLLRGAIARLPAGVSVASAQASIDALAARLRQENGNDYPAGAGWALRAVTLHDDLVGEVRPALIALLAAVGLVLLIVCANVANLMLARSTMRQREVAIRQALGAGRWRVTRQLLCESVLLGAIGGGIGVVLAIWGVEALTTLSPANLPRLHATSIDRMALAFAAGVSLVTSVLFGFAPAIHGSRADLQSVMRETTPARGSSRLRGALIVAEFALALVLLVGAALLVQTVWHLQRVELGFNPESALTARLWLPQPNEPSTGPYFTHRARVQFYQQVLDRIATLPGVQSSGGVSNLPLGGTRSRLTFSIEGQEISARDVPASELALATPGYFPALSIGLVSGRLFDQRDDDRAPPVVVVSESFARRFFPGADPIGRRLIVGAGGRPAGPVQPSPAVPLTIVGIVRDVKTERLDAAATPMLYRPVLQASNLNLTLVVRASGSPERLAESIRREVRAADPNEPVFGVRTMDEVVAKAVGQRRFAMLLLVVFAVVALVLAAIGIYGVMAYFVSHRAREIGIRMALGASSRDILTMVIAQGARLTIAGVAIGLGAAIAVTRAMSTLLYGVGPRDPLTLGLLSAVLACVALTACYVPARRATGIDPIRALRRD